MQARAGNPTVLHTLVYGAGAVGSLVGGMLAASGQPVTFLARPQGAAQLRRDGLTVVSGSRTTTVREPHVVTEVPAGLARRPDIILLAVKSNDTQAVVAELRATGSPPPPIVCLQNGVDNETLLAEAFGASSVIAGTVTTAVSLAAPGRVIVERERGIGLGGSHPLAPRLAASLAAGGLAVRLYDDAAAMKWSKLLTNLPGNATSAICDLPPADIFAHPGMYRVEWTALREALCVMRAKGLRPVNLPGAPAATLALAVRALPARLFQPFLRRSVARGRGDKMPSFHVDLAAGKRWTEVAYLNGAVARHGDALGIPAPVNRGLAEILTAIAEGVIPWEEFRGRPARLVQALLERRAGPNS